MNYASCILINILATFLRLLPLPCRIGLRRVGNPGRNSPVLLTGNYHLTVARVVHHLKGIDCYLLVCNSRGINVWCGAAGGHFTTHDVISAIKTSGLGQFVNHRKIILPQLSATGVEGGAIAEKTGWEVVWGPVYARDIPTFLERGSKTRQMSTVEFPLSQRIEMAAAWAFPISLIGALIMLLMWPVMVMPLIYLIWGLSFGIYIAFPMFEQRLRRVSRHPGFILFDFGKGGFQLILWLVIMSTLTLYSLISGDFSAGCIIKWGIFSFIIILILCMDLTGSTPVIKSAIHDDITLNVHLDLKRCTGTGNCLKVCPRGCFEMPDQGNNVSMPGARRCVKCGACIVQCPNDALCFKAREGTFIPPDTIRKFKLNLLGKRSRPAV